MAKALKIDLEKCVGCRTCEMVCSAKHAGIINPFQSRIKVIREQEWEGVPMTCAQCEDPQCGAVCPVKAISRDEVLGRVVIDYDRCIGCRMCVTACPFGLMNFDSVAKRVTKCDLCDGDPECAKFCFYKTLTYVDVSELGDGKRRTAAELLSRLVRKTA
ncbi:MAG: 4Fe-4S dicluster domain-containing protein [Dehalococcoidia bacterium]|jgi:Fe-S-cluster-containing hydrogenase component 2|nr:MAG: 4Fe-4S dicluster domain-containing protein [Dehalococcoidia bacterium]